MVWDYNLDLAKEAIKLGFVEINFDYIRFPSDGNIKQIDFAHLADPSSLGKSAVMKSFYEYLNKTLTFQPVITSADMFGMVLWRDDGLNICQRFADAAPNFDFVAPMVYPSHYPPGFGGFDNPADHPYEIIYSSLIQVKDQLVNSRAQLRPWLQDFDLGADYDTEKVQQQIQAVKDALGEDNQSYMLWSPTNIYTATAL